MGNEMKASVLFLSIALLLTGCGAAKPKPNEIAQRAAICEIRIDYSDGSRAVGTMKNLNGRRVEEVWIQTHTDGTESEGLIVHTWDGDDRVKTTRSVDQTVVETIDYTYHDGTLMKVERDFLAAGLVGVDGTPDEVTTFKEEPGSRLELIDRANANTPLDQVPDITIRKRINGDGDVVEMTRLHGTLEVEKTLYSYKDDRLVTQSVFGIGSSDPDSVTTYHYENDRLIDEIETSPLGETKTHNTYCP